MDITNHLEGRSQLYQRYVLDLVDKIGDMLVHECLDFVVFFLSQLRQTDVFFSAVLGIFFSGNKASIYHTIYHTREIPTRRVLITPEICHRLDRSSLGDELLDNTKLEHSDVTLCKKYFFNKNMNSMARFHEGFKEIHDLRL